MSALKLKFLSHGTLERRASSRRRAASRWCRTRASRRYHRVLNEQKDHWSDDNWWEILTNPARGYSWMFTQGRGLAAWGARQGDEVNPNQFKPRGQEPKP